MLKNYCAVIVYFMREHKTILPYSCALVVNNSHWMHNDLECDLIDSPAWAQQRCCQTCTFVILHSNDTMIQTLPHQAR